MKVFISWSGEKSGAVAGALRAWLPHVLNAVEPWVSEEDIEKGSRWSGEIADQLDRAEFGVICVTAANSSSLWLNYEAGALSKRLGTGGRVAPVVVDLEKSDLVGPIAQFQAAALTKGDIRKLVFAMNSALEGSSRNEHFVDEAFEVWWPRLSERLAVLPSDAGRPPPPRPDRELLEELLLGMRQLGAVVGRVPAPTWPAARFDDAITRLISEMHVTGGGAARKSVMSACGASHSSTSRYSWLTAGCR